jgi:hypothetical protein
MCDGNGFSVHLRLKPLASPSAINGTLEFGVLLDQLQSPILFLERILRSSPSYCAIETKAIPPEFFFFIYSNSFRVSRPRFLVLGLQPLQEGRKSSKPGRSTLATASDFPPLRLTTETKFDLHSPARLEYLKPNSGNKRTKV